MGLVVAKILARSLLSALVRLLGDETGGRDQGVCRGGNQGHIVEGVDGWDGGGAGAAYVCAARKILASTALNVLV